MDRFYSSSDTFWRIARGWYFKGDGGNAIKRSVLQLRIIIVIEKKHPSVFQKDCPFFFIIPIKKAAFILFFLDTSAVHCIFYYVGGGDKQKQFKTTCCGFCFYAE